MCTSTVKTGLSIYVTYTPDLAYCAMGAERETGRKPQGERQGPHAPCEVVGGELDVVGRGAKQQ